LKEKTKGGRGGQKKKTERQLDIIRKTGNKNWECSKARRK